MFSKCIFSHVFTKGLFPHRMWLFSRELGLFLHTLGFFSYTGFFSFDIAPDADVFTYFHNRCSHLFSQEGCFHTEYGSFYMERPLLTQNRFLITWHRPRHGCFHIFSQWMFCTSFHAGAFSHTEYGSSHMGSVSFYTEQRSFHICSQWMFCTSFLVVPFFHTEYGSSHVRYDFVYTEQRSFHIFSQWMFAQVLTWGQFSRRSGFCSLVKFT